MPATLLLDDALLARLAPAQADGDLLARVADALARVERRIVDAEQIAVDSREAARRLGISERHLTSLDVPYLKLGARRVYLVETLKTWAKEHEQQEQAKAG